MDYLFSFGGRIGRGGWWLGILAAAILSIAAQLLIYAIMGSPIGMVHADGTPIPLGDPMGAGDSMKINWAVYGATLLASIPAIWISVATSISRLHDRGKSGWWYLLMFVLSFVIIGGIWMLIECGILEGQQGPNKYGPDPRGLQKA